VPYFICFVVLKFSSACKNKASIDSKKELFSGGSIYAAGFRSHGLVLVI
jgi:hypothetical protein